MILADHRIFPDEITRLYEAFALLDTPPEERLRLLLQLADRDPELLEAPMPDELLQDEELRVALAKDALFLSETQDNQATRSRVGSMLDQIRLTAEQQAVLMDWVSWENRMLKQLGAGEEWLADEKNPKEITARAAAVGIPVGALYFAGITGFSAAGLTSGLATIGGLTGLTVLGLNPMTAGIAGLIIFGITVKKISDYVLSSGKTATVENRARIEEVRSAHVRAATRLAADLEQLRSRSTTDGHHALLLTMEDGVALLEQRY